LKNVLSRKLPFYSVSWKMCCLLTVLDDNLEEYAVLEQRCETPENCRIRISFRRKKNKNISLISCESSFDMKRAIKLIKGIIH